MRTLKIHLLLLFAVASGLLLSSCEEDFHPADSEASHHFAPNEGIFKNPGGGTTLPFVKRVIKKDFHGAKGWRIIWEGGTYNSENWIKVPTIFSTINGSVHSVHYLNNTAWANTDIADMSLYLGDLQATSEIDALTKDNAKKKTRFKLSGMTVADLENAAENNPNLFTLAYEWDLDEPVGALQTPDYKAGQIYTFKTDRVPAKYGAVRIVSMSPRTIEVVVQK